MGKERDALVQVLSICHSSDPLSMRKTELLTLRTQVITVALRGLGRKYEPQPIELGEVDPDVAEAVGIVMGYQGPNTFITSLRGSLLNYGGLTDNQIDAVLRSPAEDLIAELRMLGVQNDFQYHWEAMDARREARARMRDRAKAKREEGTTNGRDA